MISLYRLVRFFLLLLPMVIVLPLDLVEIRGLSIAAPDLIIVFLLGLVALALFVRRQWYRLFLVRKEILPMLMFVLFVTLSLFVSGKLFPGLVTVVRMFEAILLAYLILKSPQVVQISPKSFFSALKLAGLVGGTYSIFQLAYGSGGVIGVAGDRFGMAARSGGLAHGGAFGAILMTSVILCFLDFFRERKMRLKLYNIVVAAITFFGLILTLNRTWLLGSLIGVLLYFATINLQRTVLVAVGLVFIGFLGWIAVEQVLLTTIYGDQESVQVIARFADITSLVSGNVARTSVGTRLKKWDVALSEFAQNPILGVGESNLYLEDAPARYDLGRTNSDSQWLDVLVQNGIFAFCLFVYMVFWLAYKHFRRCRLGDNNSRIFLAVYSPWILGAFLWNITVGYVLLYLVYIVSIGIYLLGSAPTIKMSLSSKRPVKPLV